jgi:hypothetical protein
MQGALRLPAAYARVSEFGERSIIMPNAEAEAGSRLAWRLSRSRHASCDHCLSRLVSQGFQF